MTEIITIIIAIFHVLLIVRQNILENGGLKLRLIAAFLVRNAVKLTSRAINCSYI